MSMAGDTTAVETVQPGRTSIFFGESDVRRPVVRWQGETCEERPDMLAPEEPLEIRLAGRSLTVTMRTPGHDEELVAGLLYAKELVPSAADLGAMTRDPAQPNRLDVRLSEAVDSDERWRRYTYASSSCGICGVESLEALVLNHPPVTSPLSVRVRTLYGLDARLHDVLPLDRFLLMVSGRISYEILQKALVARLPMIVAVSAPTGLAVRVADERGITLVGFLRGEHMNVYSHPERVIGS